MKFYVGNTDLSWYRYLRDLDSPPEDINFWKPGEVSFKAVPMGAPFLLKLKAPINKIAGVGFFAGYTKLPLSLAWDTFGERNGCASFDQFQSLIMSYRQGMGHPPVSDPDIGCIALTAPVFFPDSAYIDAPPDWANSIVQGKVYDANDNVGENLWVQVSTRLRTQASTFESEDDDEDQPDEWIAESPSPLWSGYSGTTQSKVRIGQGAFRLMVTNAYDRRCAVTGEGLITVLDAAHIQDYASQGPNEERNGLLLRKDIHKLFDEGILTITPELRMEVSGDIRDRYADVSAYSRLHGQALLHVPKAPQHRPAEKYLSWHNENRFRG